MTAPRLAISNLDKSFATPVLRRIGLEVAPGEIHALVGENGAGKTTLVNILTGNLHRDGGTISLDGAAYDPKNPIAAYAAGISCAAQELSIVGTLSAAENISLRALPRKYGMIDRKRLRSAAERMMHYVGLAGIRSDALAENLSIAERQLLEIARALACKCRLLILDEPTAALTAPQADRLHRIIREISAGGTSVLYISHRLRDVLQNADVVSVLRDGKVAASGPAHDFTVESLVREMTGGLAASARRDRAEQVTLDPAIELIGATTADLPYPLTVRCARGEIVGIAGLAGSGRTELLEAMFGLAPLSAGRALRHAGGQARPIGTAGQAVASGVGFVPEDRQSQGLFAGQSVRMNINVPGRTAGTSASMIRRMDEDSLTSRLIGELGIRCTDAGQNIDELSGGNQQKALLARWLLLDVGVLLLDEPTRGIDVKTKFAIYDLLVRLRSQGKSIVIASSEIEELVYVCDRIIVLSDRMIAASFSRDEFSEQQILAAAFSNFTKSQQGIPLRGTASR